jgi:hypothetical protein
VPAAAAVFALAFASPAAAQEVIPPDNGGGDQYVAPVPDAGGPRPSGPGASHPGSLSPSVRASLPPGSEGRLLTRLATDPGSGAPGAGGGSGSSSGGKDGAGGGSGGSGASGGDSAGESDVTAASAITSSVSDNPSVGLLVAGIALMTLGGAVMRISQRRRRRGFHLP